MKNPGFCPPMLFGSRVFVTLRNGWKPKESWPSDGKGACRWNLTGHAFDIMEFEVAR